MTPSILVSLALIRSSLAIGRLSSGTSPSWPSSTAFRKSRVVSILASASSGSWPIVSSLESLRAGQSESCPDFILNYNLL